MVQTTTLTLEDLRVQRDEIVQVASRYGARNVRVFGSVARGDAIASSDVDLLVDLDNRATGLAYFGQLDDLRQELSAVIGRHVDLIDAAALRRLRDRILREAVPL
jgi:predicted nucleotidyltransferase